MQSDKWKHKRLLRLKVDRFKCRTCSNTEDLEVHHVSYQNLGNEDLEDLITLCKDCHNAITNVIRQRRYSSRDIQFLDYQEKEVLNYVEKDGSKVDWDCSVDNAQWRISESSQQSHKRNDKDFWQENKDRCRP